MSLQLAAEHLSTKGRGPDDTLVHMSRGEVKSLNDLAMAHGGQLTINPQTGLPEAGFLSSILPMVAGMALNAYAPGLGSVATGALVGGASYLMNPKAGLMGGLMAGMGAYGGAGLGNALAAQGMEQATAASLANNPEYLAQQEAIKNATTNQLAGGANALSPEAYADQMRGLGTSATNTYNTAYNAVKPTDFMGRADMLGQGVKSLGTEGGFSNLTDKLGGPMGTATKVGSALAPALLQEKAAPGAPVVDKDLGQRYTYSPGVAKPLPAADVPTYEDMLTKQGNFGKQQNYYPNQGYTKVSSDEAKNIYGFAGGGPVEQMSNNAAMGANTMYPMSNMATSSFATPYQTPQSTNMLANMVAPSGGGAVGAMSGEPSMQGTRMANGGISGSGNLDLSIPLDFGGGSGGGFGGAGANGYSAVGSGGGSQTGFTGQNNTAIGAKGEAGQSPIFNTAQTPFDPTYMDTFQPQGTRAFGGNPQQMIGLLSSLMQGQQSGNASAQQPMQMANGGMAMGGISDARYNLGGYSDGGRLLRGPGDGVSDSIPAVIGKKQPARLADGEFVVPARIVSELGNGSTEAGARKLYGMMDRVQAARGKTVGKGRVAKNTRADKYLPA